MRRSHPWDASLGTDGFGRSDNREHLRCHFEVSAESIVAATLTKLARGGKVDTARAQVVFAELGLDTEKDDPRDSDPSSKGLRP